MSEKFQLWYEVRDWPTINEVKVTKFTDKSVWVASWYGLFNETNVTVDRRDRISRYSTFFPTPQEAISYLGKVRNDKVSAIVAANEALKEHDRMVGQYVKKYAPEMA